MSGDQNFSNYPRGGDVVAFDVNAKVLRGAVRLGFPLVCVFSLLTVAGIANFYLNQDGPSGVQFGMMIGIAKVVVYLFLGFVVSQWFEEAYRSVCGLRGYRRRFNSKQVIGLCTNPFLGFLPNAYFAEWLYAKSSAADATTMDWKSPWSSYAVVNLFAIPLAIYDGLVVCGWVLPFFMKSPVFLYAQVVSQIMFPFVMFAGHRLGTVTSEQILELADQASLRN